METQFRNKIQVVHLVTNLQSHGAERIMAKIVTESDPAKFHHHVVSMGSIGPIGEYLRAEGITVEALAMSAKLSLAIAPFRFAAILRRFNPDVLHCWMYHANLFGALIAKIASVPHIVWSIRASNTNLAYYSLLTRAVVLWGAPLSRWVDVVTVNSEAGKELHQSWGYQARNMRFVPNGFDLQSFNPDYEARNSMRSELGIDDNVFLIGFMARFHPIKDHSTFLKSAALLQSRFPHIRFLLCGDGMTYDNAALAQMISDNHLNQRIFLLGPRSDIARLMNALDVHCLSSTSEAFPNVVGEAMACAVPCVVTDVGDSANIVGDTGYIVPPQDFQAMADACTRFVEMNAEARKDMGQRARIRIASRFDLKNMVQDYYRIYESMTRTIEPKTTYSMAT